MKLKFNEMALRSFRRGASRRGGDSIGGGRSRWEGAFTMVEAIVSSAITSIVFVGLYGGISYGFSLVNLSRENLRATQIMVDKLEAMRLFNWNQVTTNGFVPTSFTANFFPETVYTNADNEVITSGIGFTYYGTLSVVPADVANNYTNRMRKVIVTLNWTNSGVSRLREMSTYVSENGLQNYVY